jgi:pimeloyl-ACP methyl ester carboxylesterase
MSDTPTLHRFAADDRVDLAWHELGTGRPVVLIHGLFSSATINWIRFGHGAAIAARGFRVIMPDLRAHGESFLPTGRARPGRHGADPSPRPQRL